MKSDAAVSPGILLVVFGSLDPETIRLYQNILAIFEQRFPDALGGLAYTSSAMRKKAAAAGQPVDSIVSALARMLDAGVTHIAVQSLHIIPGLEFHEMVQTVRGFQRIPHGFRAVGIGLPLLAGEPDFIRVKTALLRLAPQPLAKNEAVVFMGHGSNHPSHASYQALAAQLNPAESGVYLGVLKGTPSLDDILFDLAARRIERVHLLPFMSVAGAHAKNDMAGDQPESWKSRIESAGFQCVPTLKGLAENPEFIRLWVDLMAVAYQWSS